MNLLEIWRGTPQELKAIARAENLDDRKISPKEKKKRHDEAFSAQRRILLKKIFLATGFTGVGSAVIVAAKAIADGQERADILEADKESAYQSYIESFSEVAKGDTEAEAVLMFLKERRRRGKLVGDKIYADEPGVAGVNFYTVMVDPVRDSKFSQNMGGAGVFRNDDNPQSLLLRTSSMSSVWKGVLLGHEGLHVYQWLNNIEQRRPDGFYRGEQEAYDLEFRLLDRTTEGRFKQALMQQAPSVAQNSYRGRLSSEDERIFQSLFPPAQSEEEMAFRIPAYIVALNFTLAERRSDSISQATDAKIKYMQQLFNGSIPLMR